MKTKALAAIVVLILASAAVISSPRAQEAEWPPPGTRLALYEGLPAIDRGLHAEKLEFATRWAGEVVGVSDDGPYQPGRVIVKYRPGLSQAALAAVTSAV